jgi:hypothetical protein
MQIRKPIIAAAVVAAIAGTFGIVRSQAQRKETPNSIATRNDIELTVYPQDFGLVREIRPIQLASGDNQIDVPDVSKQLDPQSVLLGCKSQSGVELTAHAYDLGASDSAALLSRYVGKNVDIVRYGDNGHEAERQHGKLMMGQNGGVVLQDGDKLFVNPPGTVVAPVNVDSSAIPKLTVQAQSKSAQPADLEVAYLTRGLFWSADYVAVLDPKSDKLNLECWATVTNRSGADYPSAKVTLMAGTPNRAVELAEFAKSRLEHRAYGGKPSKMPGNFDMEVAAGKYRSISSPESIGDQHAYPVKAATSIAQERMNRLLMFNSDKVGIKKDYSSTMPRLYAYDGGEWGSPNQPKRGSVQASLVFYNKDTEGLGQPLPQGAIRIYEPDKAGSLRYAGAGNVDNTPKDQRVGLTLANAFDLFMEARVTKVEKLGKKKVRKYIEVTLHNEKAAEANLRIVQNLGGRWEIPTESHKHTKLNAYSIQWMVPVAPGGETKLTYSVNMSW